MDNETYRTDRNICCCWWCFDMFGLPDAPRYIYITIQRYHIMWQDAMWVIDLPVYYLLLQFNNTARNQLCSRRLTCNHIVSFQVLTALNTKAVIFWAMTPCSLETCRLYVQGRWWQYVPTRLYSVKSQTIILKTDWGRMFVRNVG
jgi:hypothetical protein